MSQKNKRGRNNRTHKQNLSYRGVDYKSQFELDVAKELYRKKRRKGGVPFDFKYEEETLPYILEKKYTPDFRVALPSGEILYIEVKGYFDREARGKMIAVKEQHPDKRIVLVFLRNNKIDKRSKMLYSDWAEKYGFEYAIQELPDEWFQ